MNDRFHNPYSAPAHDEAPRPQGISIREHLGIVVLSGFVGFASFFSVGAIGGAILRRLLLKAPKGFSFGCWMVLFWSTIALAVWLGLKCYWGLKHPGHDPRDRGITRDGVVRSRDQ
ncbi:MAG: hypothetical protein R3C49_12005 [Planctomycetaceae bacterium]